MAIGIYISITVLNVNGLNAPTKSLAKWIKKTRPVYMLSTKWPTSDLETESEGMEKGILCKWVSKESWSSN